MGAAVFFYNIIITAAYIFCCVIFLALYKKFREKCLLNIALVFFLFVLDNLVLYMNEFLPSFSIFYDTAMFTIPYITNMLVLAIVFSYRLSLVSLIDEFFSTAEILVWTGTLIAVFAATALSDHRAAVIINDIILSFAGVGTFFWSLRHFEYYKALIPRPGVPKIQKSFLAISLLLQAANAVETLIARLGIDLLGPDRKLSIELIGIYYAVLGIAFALQLISSSPEATLPSAVESREIDANVLSSFGNKYFLTPREQDVLLLIVGGKSIAEICEALFIAQGTVKTHTHNIYQKLDIKSRKQLTAMVASFQAEK
ncbi:MAG: LuxR C-terminal-related transcriptional regulator [Clostridia bacterium]